MTMLQVASKVIVDVAPRHTPNRVFVHDATKSPWVEAGKPGLFQKLVRGDEQKGEFLGLLGFEPLVASGLHQHTGVTTTYMLSGSLTDYWGTYKEGVTGINLEGSTHDAICYTKCSMVNRLEAPVLYPQDFALHTLHHGSRHGEFSNPAPEMTPTMNIDVMGLPVIATLAAGVTRRMIFDYGKAAQHGRPGASANHRHVCLSLLPQTKIPIFHITAPTEFFVLGGEISVNGTAAGPATFVIVEPDTDIELHSEFGAMLLAWADGPTGWIDKPSSSDLFGF
jgi:hypothetical protein